MPKQPKVSFAKVARFGFGVTMQTIPVLFVTANLIAVAHGLSYGFSTFMYQQFYDAVEAAVSGNGLLRSAIIAITVLGLVSLAREILNGVHNFMHQVCFTKMNGELNRIIHDKMARIDPVCLEDTRLHDDINKAQEGAGTIQFIISIGFTILTFYLPFFAFMAVYLYYLKPLFIISMALIFLPVLAGQLMRTHIIEKFEDKAAPIRREFDAHEQAITHKDFFKETRLLGGYTFFLRLFMDTLRRLGKAEWEANRKTNLLNLCMNLFTILGHGGIIYLLFDALLAGEISVGAFAAVYGSIGLLFAVMDEIVHRHVGNIASNLGKAHHFIRFMELPERGGSAGLRDRQAGIVAEGACFRYPNATENSVSDIQLHIKAGETVAIVGENGAGKTTLARLLTGIYKPSAGRVRVNGLDTATTDAARLFGHMSGVFQKYQRYQMTLDENIRISDTLRETDASSPTRDEAAIDEALAQAGVDLQGGSFPNGLETMLSREFEGVDLSGGEWQRVAIARGLYRVHDTIFLDEPTAAIDPLEESRIYKQFIDISREKTAVIITHRLGSAKIADRVLVMDKGRIVGDGTHQSLMENCALYRDMYNAQSEWYKETPAIL